MVKPRLFAQQKPVAALAIGFLIAVPALAQHPPMQAPMVPQAIETHMQQKRALEQREAMDAKKGQPVATTSKSTPAGSSGTDKPVLKRQGKKTVDEARLPKQGSASTP